MYQLINNPILLPHQVEILELFFVSPLGKQYFLTGGTALSAFYLAHRESKDLDLFTLEDTDLLQTEALIKEISGSLGAVIETKVQSNHYREIYIVNKDEGWTQRLDLVKEIPKHFGKIVEVEKMRVDSLENIGSNKVLAVFGRLEIKDYVDLYVVLTKTKLTFDQLFEMAREKDTGLFEFYFANIIRAAQNFESFPVMKIAFDKKEFKNFYENLSRDLLLKIKPNKLVLI